MLIYIVLHFQQRGLQKSERQSKQTDMAQNVQDVLLGVSHIFMDLKKHLSSPSNPASMHSEGILTALIKLILGEPFKLQSDLIINPNAREKGFFSQPGVRDETDIAFDLMQQSSHSNCWSPLLYKTACPIYREMLPESGMATRKQNIQPATATPAQHQS